MEETQIVNPKRVLINDPKEVELVDQKHLQHNPSSVAMLALSAAGQVVSVPAGLAQKVADRLSGAGYLIPGFANDDELKEEDAESFIRYWHSPAPRGPMDFARGKLPKHTPLQKFLNYSAIKTMPEDLPNTAITMKINRKWEIPMPAGRHLIPLQVFSSLEAPISVDPNAITGQAHRQVLKSPDLLNGVAYWTKRGKVIIRRGVVDTERRADQLLAITRYVQGKLLEMYGVRTDAPRLVSQQLNTKGMFGIGEQSLITNQAAQAHLLEKRRRAWLNHIDGPLGAHFNTAIADVSKILPGQGKFSRELNAYGTAVFLDWMVQDFFPEETPDFLKPALNSLKQLMKAYTLDDNEKKIKKYTETLSDQLKDVLAPLHTLHQELAATESANPGQVLATKLLTQLIAVETSQEAKYGFPVLRPAQEIGLRLLCVELFKATIQINCYSGYDRTGFVAAIALALDDKFESCLKRLKDPIKALDAVYTFLMDFEDKVMAMDKHLKDVDPSLDLQTWVTDKQNKKYKSVIRFQNVCTSYFLGVSAELTFRSSGTWGMKWRQKLENSYMIPYVARRMKDDATKMVFAIVTLKTHKFTPEGVALFIGKGLERPG